MSTLNSVACVSITERSSKAELIQGACELIDTQAEMLMELKQRQQILWWVVGVLSIALVLHP